MKQLEKPVIPVNFLQDLFAECGGESLYHKLTGKPTEAEKAACDSLYQVIRWFNDLRQETADNAGLITQASNAAAVDMMLKGFDAMRAVGGLS